MCTVMESRGKRMGAIVFAVSDSGRKYTPTDLAVAEDLAHRAAISIENARLYAEVRENARRKDEFLAMLAHELRNPLAPIRTGLDLMDMPECDAATAAWARGMMKQQLQQLIRLVEDLLDVSRIMRGKIQLRKERTLLAEIVARGVETARPAIDAAKHELVVSMPKDPVWVDVDPVRIAQVVANLLNNAAKYNDKPGHILVSAAARGGGGRRPRDGRRRRHRQGPLAAGVRPLHPGRPLPGAIAGGLGHRPDLGPQPRRAPRRQRRGVQRRAWPGERVRRPPARAGRPAEQRGGSEGERPGRGRFRSDPAAGARLRRQRRRRPHLRRDRRPVEARRPRHLHRRRRPGIGEELSSRRGALGHRPARHERLSGRGSCAASRSSRTRCSWRSPATARTRIGGGRARRVSTITSSSRSPPTRCTMFWPRRLGEAACGAACSIRRPDLSAFGSGVPFRRFPRLTECV